MSETGDRELTFVLLSMAFLFVLALVAVGIFFRQWRREKANPPPRRKPATGDE